MRSRAVAEEAATAAKVATAERAQAVAAATVLAVKVSEATYLAASVPYSCRVDHQRAAAAAAEVTAAAVAAAAGSDQRAPIPPCGSQPSGSNRGGGGGGSNGGGGVGSGGSGGNGGACLAGTLHQRSHRPALGTITNTLVLGAGAGEGPGAGAGAGAGEGPGAGENNGEQTLDEFMEALDAAGTLTLHGQKRGKGGHRYRGTDIPLNFSGLQRERLAKQPHWKNDLRFESIWRQGQEVFRLKNGDVEAIKLLVGKSRQEFGDELKTAHRLRYDQLDYMLVKFSVVFAANIRVPPVNLIYASVLARAWGAPECWQQRRH